jgi:DNA-directed RNA polymerase specialized sigma24 family protein
MSDQPEMSKGSPIFSTTHWSVILQAGDSQLPQSEQALERLCRAYWYPLYAFVRRRGFDADLAQDITQGFFACLLEKKTISVADPARGRFRTFLLTSLNNYLHNEWDRANRQKRGGGREILSMDALPAEERYSLEPADHLTPERLFDQRWAQEVVDRATERLQKEFDSAGQGERLARLRSFLLSDPAGASHTQVAVELDMSIGAVRTAIHRLRRRFGELLRVEIAETVTCPEELDAEIRHLLQALGGSPSA